MANVKVTLKNSFHNTKVIVIVPEEEAENAWSNIQYRAFDCTATKADKARYRRVKNALCGMSDCTCGTVR